MLDLEVPGDTFEELAQVIRYRMQEVATFGQSLIWSVDSQRRRAEVSVIPRNGRTTIRITEDMGHLLRQNFGGQAHRYDTASRDLPQGMNLARRRRRPGGQRGSAWASNRTRGSWRRRLPGSDRLPWRSHHPGRSRIQTMELAVGPAGRGNGRPAATASAAAVAIATAFAAAVAASGLGGGGGTAGLRLKRA